MNSLMIGDSVSWVSALGWKEGTVKKILLAKNANRALVPWIDIEYEVVHGAMCTVRICATESNLKMMRVKIMEAV